MSNDTGHGFHAGEHAVQQLAGVRESAARLEPMLGRASLSEGVAGFLAGRSFAAMTARDGDGLLWVSPLVGRPGFLEAVARTTVQVRTAPPPGDPLHGLNAPQPIGLIAVDYARRRRFRLNGNLVVAGPDGLTVEVDEAFGNCPQFLPRRAVEPLVGSYDAPADSVEASGPRAGLGGADRGLVERADTLFLGTTHPGHGNDASHRGGPPGFVRTDGRHIWWPDYPGNNLFTSLGNISVDPEAALLFPDFDGGTALHVRGTAELRQVPVGAAGDDGHTGRRVELTVRRIVRSRLAVSSNLLEAYPPNPPVTD
jgi:predicted pyridoxine 5'-phosphate oxidase superfamily flavin-nucleotide-binding protein